MKKLCALVLCVSMLLSMFPISVSAASANFQKESELASGLRELGIFKGVSENDFALDRAPTRAEALVMLIRILGKEDEALEKGGSHPFVDVPQWVDKYVGYAYQSGLTNGVSSTSFGTNNEASAAMYITFVLRALGYSDKNGADFTWDNPYELAKTTGILEGNPNAHDFMRADVVLISYAALNSKIKGTEKTLAEKLIEADVFSATDFEKNYNANAFKSASPTGEFTAEEIYAKCSSAVFYIEVYDEKGTAFASGSGFFINHDGTAVTNYHVIEDAAKAKVKLAGIGKEFDVVGVYDYNVKEDWAVIKVNGTGFSYLERDEAKVLGGSTIFTIGSPLGLDNTISQGLISNVNRVFEDVSYIQISAAISHGSSGGALINKYGKVIGITSAGFDEGQNLNLALPISLISKYDSSKITPLSELKTSQVPPTSGQISGSEKSKKAFEALTKWIKENYNYEYGGRQYYRETYDEDGYVDDYQVYINYGVKESVCVSYSYLNDEGNCVMAITGFDAESDEVLTTYVYFDDITSSSRTSEGVIWEVKSKFKEDMAVVFEEYTGPNAKFREEDEEIASFVMYDSMYLIKLIFDEIPGYSIEDVGFTSIK